jgi:hypothetical protein
MGWHSHVLQQVQGLPHGHYFFLPLRNILTIYGIITNHCTYPVMNKYRRMDLPLNVDLVKNDIKSNGSDNIKSIVIIASPPSPADSIFVQPINKYIAIQANWNTNNIG